MILHIRLLVKMDFVTDAHGIAYYEIEEPMGGKKMSNYYIHVGSITNAMRGKQLLEAEGIRAYLHRTSHPTDGDGCGYSLLVSDRVDKAVNTLKKRGVRVIRVTDAM